MRALHVIENDVRSVFHDGNKIALRNIYARFAIAHRKNILYVILERAIIHERETNSLRPSSLCCLFLRFRRGVLCPQIPLIARGKLIEQLFVLPIKPCRRPCEPFVTLIVRPSLFEKAEYLLFERLLLEKMSKNACFSCVICYYIYENIA